MKEVSAVLTGDIVGSRRLPPELVDEAMELISKLADNLSKQHGIQTYMARNRGDGWQIALSEGQSALGACLQVFARLKAELQIETRAGIGLGHANIPRNGDLAAGSGLAFQTAGKVLDSMPKTRRIDIGTDVTRGVSIIVQLLDEKMQSWTCLQAGAVAAALSDRELTHQVIAGKFGVTRQTIQRRLASAGLMTAQNSVEYFESHIIELWEKQQV